MNSLLVGILCEDGVVVGSADSGPRQTGGLDPAEESWANTLVVERDLILAGTGRIGLGQRFADVVAAIRSDSRFPDWTGLAVAKFISAEVADDFASTRADKGQFGALVAFSACDGFHLCEFAQSDLQPELKTPERWFASMGAGRPVAEPFLHFLQRVYFAGSPPVLKEAAFAAAWALDFAAGLPAAAVAAAPQIAVLAQETPGMSSAARLLSAQELADQIADVRAAEKHLAAYRRGPGC
ncbi:MAG: hypothetical protein A2V98_16935 [Planctomycetes bacterium RBG_16_64_12]|nr:MAG: hypothetical protein A2V98_16935 [Planctomycetes bacterium RBG_16_64_12]